jgi:hypothetical protein
MGSTMRETIVLLEKAERVDIIVWVLCPEDAVGLWQ